MADDDSLPSLEEIDDDSWVSWEVARESLQDLAFRNGYGGTCECNTCRNN